MDSFLERLQKGDIPIVQVGGLAVLLVVTALLYVQMKPSTSSSSSSSPSDDTTMSAKKASSYSKNNTVVPNMKNAAPPPVNDVWEERRKRGIAHATTVKKADAKKEDKPFGSSYYYAHNSTKNKGGYSDGLRMEDFTMNGPRLLSKGGKADHEIMESEVEAPQVESTEGPISKETPLVPSTTIIAKNITRYLWDDPGDSKGIGTIRIDTLPGASSSSDYIDWKDAKIQTVSASLEGKGLLVIATDEDKKEYRLRIQTLYDTVSEVRTVVKTKRLLVKLHKQKSFGKANLNSWPHPQKKNL